MKSKPNHRYTKQLKEQNGEVQSQDKLLNKHFIRKKLGKKGQNPKSTKDFDEYHNARKVERKLWTKFGRCRQLHRKPKVNH